MFLLRNTLMTQNKTINFFDNILNQLNTFNYDRSSSRLILRININNSKEKKNKESACGKFDRINK